MRINRQVPGIVGSRCQLIDKQIASPSDKHLDTQNTNDIQRFEYCPRNLNGLILYLWVERRRAECDIKNVILMGIIEGTINSKLSLRIAGTDDGNLPLKVNKLLEDGFICVE